jgi:cytochrome oxidase Cu insertion factor (SCO1/SenC/PrrC family)
VRRGRTLAAALLLLGAGGAGVAGAQDALYVPPAPGTYELPPITRVADATLLDPSGARVPLLGLAEGQVALVSFVYRSCSDGAACPAALAAWKQVDALLAARPALASRVRLVTVSFDPVRDTPEKMGALARALAPRGDWRFLTAADAAELRAALGQFGQDVTPVLAADGRETGELQHLVRAYLVDARGDVRGVYGAAFLVPQLLVNDAETALGAETRAAVAR